MIEKWNAPSTTQLDSLDAVATSPEHHKLMFENDRVRVLDTLIPAGERSAVHTHRWHGVAIYLESSDIVRYDSAGNVEVDSRKLGISFEPGSVMWLSPSAPHSVENVGEGPVRAIVVELKD